MTDSTAEHEYVEYVLDVKAGQIVGCEFFGEGRQVEPLTEPVLLQPLTGDRFPRGWKRIDHALKRAFRHLRAGGEAASK